MNTHEQSNAGASERTQLESLQLQNELYRRAQVVLQESCEESLSIFENAPIGFLVLDATGSIQKANKRAAEGLGLRPDQLRDKYFQQFVCEPSAAMFAEHLIVATGQKRSATSDLLLCRADGDSFWARTRSELAPANGCGCPDVMVTIDEIDDLMLDIRSHSEVASASAESRVLRAGESLASILLIDDEELILNSVSRVLHRMGYEITSYSDPREALLAFESAPLSFDAVISDYQMPELNGLMLCERIARIRSDVPILLTSAFIGEIDLVAAKEAGVEYVMPKPLSTDELTFWLNDVMQEIPNPR